MRVEPATNSGQVGLERSYVEEVTGRVTQPNFRRRVRFVRFELHYIVVSESYDLGAFISLQPRIPSLS